MKAGVGSNRQFSVAVRLLGVVVLGLAMLLALVGPAAAATYYVKNGGNDSKSGLSDANAWATLNRVKTQNLAPGDIVQLKRGSIWNETLYLDEYETTGTITVQPYGTDLNAPLINGGEYHAITNVNGVTVYPISRWTIKGLKLTSTNNQNPNKYTGWGTDGIHLKVHKNTPCYNLTIQDCEILNTSGDGIQLLSDGGPGPGNMTFDHLTISNCTLHDLGVYGIWFDSVDWTYWHYDQYPYYTITGCTIYQTGKPGIEIRGGKYGLIDNCTTNYACNATAYEAGAMGYGIWIYFNYSSTIQKCISQNTYKQPGCADSGGFDIGASEYCLVQYNQSLNNQGIGYQFDTGGGYGADNNHVARFNLSLNDWQGLCSGLASNSRFYNNTLITYAAWAVPLYSQASSGILFANNICIQNDSSNSAPVVQIRDQGNPPTELTFKNNLYWHINGMGTANRFHDYTTGVWRNFDQWEAWVNPGGHQEKAENPLLVNPDAGDVHLQAGSPCIGAGLWLNQSPWYEDMGTHDLYGYSPIPNPPDIGAAIYTGGGGGGDVTVTLTGTPDQSPITGWHDNPSPNGIDFGSDTTRWICSNTGPTPPEGCMNEYSNPNATRSVWLPTGKVLKSVYVRPTNGTTGTITFTAPGSGNPQIGPLTLAEQTYTLSSWTNPCTEVQITLNTTAGLPGYVGFDNFVFGDPPSGGGDATVTFVNLDPNNNVPFGGYQDDSTEINFGSGTPWVSYDAASYGLSTGGKCAYFNSAATSDWREVALPSGKWLKSVWVGRWDDVTTGTVTITAPGSSNPQVGPISLSGCPQQITTGWTQASPTVRITLEMTGSRNVSYVGFDDFVFGN